MRGLLTELGMNTFTVAAMIVSLVAFTAILFWVYTRPQEEIDAQAKLYDDDDNGLQDVR